MVEMYLFFAHLKQIKEVYDRLYSRLHCTNLKVKSIKWGAYYILSDDIFINASVNIEGHWPQLCRWVQENISPWKLCMAT